MHRREHTSGTHERHARAQPAQHSQASTPPTGNTVVASELDGGAQQRVNQRANKAARQAQRQRLPAAQRGRPGAAKRAVMGASSRMGRRSHVLRCML